MNKLKLFSCKAYILVAALVSALFETLAIAVLVGVAAAFALVVLPLLNGVASVVAVGAKLKMVR